MPDTETKPQTRDSLPDLLKSIGAKIPQGQRVYHVTGQLFFASADQFTAAFDFAEPVQRVVIDLTHAHIWDISSVASLDKAVIKFRKLGREVSLQGLNEASATIVDNLGTHHKADPDIILGH